LTLLCNFFEFFEFEFFQRSEIQSLTQQKDRLLPLFDRFYCLSTDSAPTFSAFASLAGFNFDSFLYLIHYLIHSDFASRASRFSNAIFSNLAHYLLCAIAPEPTLGHMTRIASSQQTHALHIQKKAQEIS
jgi:hypothetical protein